MKKLLSNHILEILTKYWNYNEFRYPQKEIILEVLNGSNVLGLMPTGAGKSICYQIPALINPGVCIVISSFEKKINNKIMN